MFIVLEGSDASGKSTIAAAVKSQLERDFPGKKIHEFHKGRPEELTRRWVLNEYAVSVEKTDWTAEISIADRWHWGEVTYAPLKRPDTNKDGFGLLGRAGWRWVELFMASRGMTQFWVYQPSDVVKTRLGTRGDDFVSAHEIDEIIDLYSRASDAAYLIEAKVQVPDGHRYVDGVASAIISKAKERAGEAAVLSEFPEYIGPPHPRILLVGDRQNTPGETILPFLPVNGNSGEYLLSCLPELLWRSVGIINAQDFRGERINRLLGTLGKPRIAVLGRLAEHEMMKSGVDKNNYVVFPHPQYVRRFHHSDNREYGMAIQSYAYSLNERYMNWILP